MIDKIKKIKLSRNAIDWWNGLPIQNLVDMNDSWVGYVCKYYPNKTDIYHLTNKEIINIYKQENFK